MALRQAAAQAATLLRLSGRPAATESLWVSLSRRAISTTHFASSEEVRDGLHYAESHEWVKVDGDIGTVGISDHAQQALGDIVFVELPEEGLNVEAQTKVSSVESVKAVSDIYSPVSGTVVEINTVLADSPETINRSPYEDGWFFKVKLDKGVGDHLMDAAKYKDFQDGGDH